MGVAIVSRILSDEFGWLFKRNHQEHDFGIDGQVEIVQGDGSVTGQVFAVQIKCGTSFFEKRNKWGFVYRGESKHLNYLSNYPLPVVLCLCNPENSECYWTQFLPELTEGTPSGWTIAVPFENRLRESEESLLKMVGPARDVSSDLRDYWGFNKIVAGAQSIVCIVTADEVSSGDIQGPVQLFSRLRATKQLADASRGKVEVSFHGYDDDPRELWEIPEVRAHVQLLDRKLSGLLYFAGNEEPSFTLRLFALCQTSVARTPLGPEAERRMLLEMDAAPLGRMIERHIPELNHLASWVGMSENDQRAFFRSIVRVLGLKPPPEIMGSD